jgi:hypothetical protein
MMPFWLEWKDSLPEEFHPYWDMITTCSDLLESDGADDRLAYLTVDERDVIPGGASHRRGGLHTESPGKTISPILSTFLLLCLPDGL